MSCTIAIDSYKSLDNPNEFHVEPSLEGVQKVQISLPSSRLSSLSEVFDLLSAGSF